MTPEQNEERRWMIANLRQHFPGATIEIPEDGLMTINGEPLPIDRADRVFATNRASMAKEDMLTALIPEVAGFLTEQNDEVQRAARLRMIRTSMPEPKLLERSPEEQLLVKSGMELARNPDGTPAMVNGMPVLVPAGMGTNPNVHKSLALLQEDNKDMMPETRIHKLVGVSDMPLLIDTDKTDEDLIADGIPVTSIGYGTLKVDGKEKVLEAEVINGQREGLLRGRPDNEDGPATVGGVRLG
jgi:hypothetical protein